jgi:hypothetical protein
VKLHNGDFQEEKSEVDQDYALERKQAVSENTKQRNPQGEEK